MRFYHILAVLLGSLIIQPFGAFARECPAVSTKASPVDAAIQRPFGYRMHPILGKAVLHPALVFSTRAGLAVRAMQGGRLIKFEAAPDGGGFIWIRHSDGTELRYGPLLASALRFGACGAAGAWLGETMPAPLTLTMRREGHWVDPKRWLEGAP